jgi:hypothetical protein
MDMSPQNRWPTIATSISGIDPAVWTAFHARAIAKNMTNREAIEEAIRDLSLAHSAGTNLDWPHTTGGKAQSVEMHNSIHQELKALCKKTKLRQNVVLLTSIKRWLEKE